MWQYRYTDEIYHHGILGMKWGVRRYQNKDGSLTEAGKKHYGLKVMNDVRKETDKQYASNDSFRKAVNNYKESYAKSQASYQEDVDAWGNGTDFKNLDYYQFKDAAAMRWAETKDGKKFYADKAELNSEVNKMLSSMKDKTLDSIEVKMLEERGRGIVDYYVKENSKFQKPFSNLTAKKSELLANAKNNDQYNIDFLEMCPDDIMDTGGANMIKEYEKFLTDPEAWMENRYRH